MYVHTLNSYLKKAYGEKVYKLSLSGAFTCPNRDGTRGTGGCTFCSAGGSGDFAEDASLPFSEQMTRAKARIAGKTGARLFIAYFQSFTGTYAPTETERRRLQDLYRSAASYPDVVAVSIGTRPDCLDENWLNFLGKLNAVKPVWVELGLQTSKPETAERIRRGYGTEEYRRAVCELNALGIKVVTHVILGLPGETEENMENTVQYALACGTWGLKLQLLHVLEGTALAAEYRRDPFPVLTQEEYIDLICRLLPQIPENIVLHRLTGDGPKRILIAPEWSGNKRAVLNAMNRALRERDVVQGSGVTFPQDPPDTTG